ncbi:glycosyltransferase 87 family protein [Actinomadura scrupuli]|uniref:glycosyltransferase 87 family protein n=1 Tax=Actinomadura scrupuli TaxID=559629 RepID=UPI003D95F351
MQAVAWAVFAGGAWLVRGLPVRAAVLLIIVGGIGLQVAAFSAPPRTSSDSYRYIWDGRVQAAGIDPYRYVPAAPELSRYRDPSFLWQRTTESRCVGPGVPDPDSAGELLAPGCTLINRPAVHTIYPPVAEGYFVAVHALSPGNARTRPIQIAAAVVAVATTVLLVVGLSGLGRDPRLAVLWAWCPLVALEAGNNAHVDVVEVFLMLGALLVLARAGSRRRALLGGVVLGLAVAAKFLPVLVAPAIARRRPFEVALAAAGAIGAVYLPHVLAVGGGVLGYLPGYLKEEGYESGSRFALLGLVVPHMYAGPVAVMVLAVAALAVWRTADPERPWRGALVMAGVFLLVTSPALPWYGELVIVLVALDGRAEWLAVGAGGHLMWAMIDLGLPAPEATRIGYGTGALVVLLVSVVRRTLDARRTPAPEEEPVVVPA